jgi:hypothetical protein
MKRTPEGTQPSMMDEGQSFAWRRTGAEMAHTLIRHMKIQFLTRLIVGSFAAQTYPLWNISERRRNLLSLESAIIHHASALSGDGHQDVMWY